MTDKPITLPEWLEKNKELCDQLPPGELAVDYDKRSGGADQIVLADGTGAAVAFMSTGWNSDDPDDNTNPFAEFFVASRLSLPQAIRIIETLSAMPPGKWGQVERWRWDTNKDIAEKIINERDEP